MSLQCELSGELLSASPDAEAVVTPSGHICIKRLLLAKLTENGGMDPFHEDRPLSEDQLVVLNISKSPSIVPPRPNQTTSMPGLLGALQNEYDALVLELFDTRKALEETRRELSQALYQNDAAMRVVARMASERDEARQQLQNYSANGGAMPTNGQEGPNTVEQDTNGEGSQSNKKRKLEETSDLPLVNDIPQADVDQMIAVWEKEHKNRKADLKAAAAAAPKKEDLAAYAPADAEAWHATTCKGVLAMSEFEGKLVTAGKDKSVLIYDTASRQVVQSLASDVKASSIDMNGAHVVAGLANGKIQVWEVSSGTSLGVIDSKATKPIVAVNLHPGGKHIFAASASGQVLIVRMEGLETISVLSDSSAPVSLSSGILHPDGLIYFTGTDSGEVQLWDLKSKTLASKVGEPSGDAIVSIQASNNGYHLAVGHSSGMVKVWDLRKQKCIATMNNDKALDSISAVAFDSAGKYLAYGGKKGTKIVAVKEWDTVTATYPAKVASSIVWGPSFVASSSIQQRDVAFFMKA